MVSANDAAFELFLYEENLTNFDDFLSLLNLNLPPDIKATEIKEVNQEFNIIQHPKTKEYLYLFSFGKKNHPFCAPLIANIQKDLDLDKMKVAAEFFRGKHNFRSYCAGATEKTRFEREILISEIVDNNLYSASFFPEKSYIYRVQGSGFLRYQVRLMMGALIQVGQGELSLEDIKNSLDPGNDVIISYIAPGSGLILNKTEFQ